MSKKGDAPPQTREAIFQREFLDDLRFWVETDRKTALRVLQIVEAVLQPSPRLKAWRLSLRTLARFALLGVALSVAIFVARFNAVSVLLGFSIVVVGIMGEALYSVIRSSAE